MAHLTAAAQTEPPKSAVFDANLDVLAFTGLALLDDPGLHRPRFGDDRWDLSAIAAIPAYARIPSALRVDWTTVVNPVWRLCAKELALALLQPDVGLDRRLPDARRRPLPPHQLTALVSQWRGWFDWLERHQVDRLAGVTQAHCDAWLAGRREEIQPSTLVDEVIKVRQFADYRQILTLDSYRPPSLVRRPGGGTGLSHRVVEPRRRRPDRRRLRGLPHRSRVGVRQQPRVPALRLAQRRRRQAGTLRRHRRAVRGVAHLRPRAPPQRPP